MQYTVCSCSDNDTEGSETLCALFNSAVHIKELFRGCTEQYSRKIVKPLYCNNSEMDIFQNMLKSMISYSELLMKTFSQMPEQKDISRKEVRAGG